MEAVTLLDTVAPLFQALEEGTEEAFEKGIRKCKRLTALRELEENAKELWTEEEGLEDALDRVGPLSDNWDPVMYGELLDSRGRYCEWPNHSMEYVRKFL